MAGERPTVRIDLDRPRRLRLSPDAVEQYEKMARRPFIDASGALQFDTVRELQLWTWALLVWEDPKLTLQDVEALVVDRLPAVRRAIKRLDSIYAARQRQKASR